MSEHVFEKFVDELDEPLSLPAGQWRTVIRIVMKRRRGNLWARLFDETGTLVLSNVRYEGIGPKGTAFSGITDEQGILLHENLPIDEYPIIVADQYEIKIPTIPTDSSEPHHQVVAGYQVEEEVDYSVEDDQIFIYPVESRKDR